MAQVVVDRIDLKNALLRMPRYPKGIKCSSQLIVSPFQILLLDAHGWMEKFGKRILSLGEQIYQSPVTLQKYFDINPPFQLEESVLTGSWSEGLFLFQPTILDPPDMDFMCILKNISFSEEDQACGNLALREDTPFVNAYLSDKELLQTWAQFLEETAKEANKYELSSRKLKLKLYENYKKIGQLWKEHLMHEQCAPVGDGPSLELHMKPSQTLGDDCFGLIKHDQLFSCDIVLSIRCGGWPENAQEWLTRDRMWPSEEIIRKVHHGGFHIVAKCSPEGNFRLSFSHAEATLLENLNFLQQKVVRSFKAIVKYFQNDWSPNIKDIISSYHLKTLAFWHVEKSTEESWTEDNLVDHLLTLFDEFVQALRKGHLPMYFLPKYNLLSNVKDLGEMKKISDKVASLLMDIPALITALDKVMQIDFNNYMYIVHSRIKKKVSALLDVNNLEVKDLVNAFRCARDYLCSSDIHEEFKKIVEYVTAIVSDEHMRQDPEFLEMISTMEEMKDELVVDIDNDECFEKLWDDLNYWLGTD